MSLLNALARMEELKQQGRQRGVQQLNDFFKNRTDQNRRKRMSKLGQKLLAQKDKSPQALEKFAQANDLKLSEMAELVQMVTGFQQYAAMQTQRQREGEMWNRGTTEWKQGQSDRTRKLTKEAELEQIRSGIDPADTGSWLEALKQGAVTPQAANVAASANQPPTYNPTETREIKVGDKIVTQQWDPEKKDWVKIAEAPRSTGTSNADGLSYKNLQDYQQTAKDKILARKGFFPTESMIPGSVSYVNADGQEAPATMVRQADQAARQLASQVNEIVRTNPGYDVFKAEQLIANQQAQAAQKARNQQKIAAAGNRRPQQMVPNNTVKPAPQAQAQTSQPTPQPIRQPQLPPNPQQWVVKKQGDRFFAVVGNNTIPLTPQQVQLWQAAQQSQTGKTQLPQGQGAPAATWLNSVKDWAERPRPGYDPYANVPNVGR